MIALPARRVADRGEGEDGFAMVIVIVVVAIAILLGAAGLAESLDTRSLTYRQARVARAQQAADAGIQAELYQQAENKITNANSAYDLNSGLLSLANFLDCTVPGFNVSGQITGLTTANVNSAGVCPSNSAGGTASPTALGDHAFEQSEYIPGAVTPKAGASEVDEFPRIVALGRDTSGASTVYSREEAILAPISPLPAIGANNSVTLSGVSALGLPLTTTLNGDVSAVSSISLPLVTVGANLTLSNGLLAVIKCGCSSVTGIPVANFIGNATVPYRQPVSVSSSKSSCPTTDSAGNSGCSALGTYYSSTTDSVTVPAGKTLTIYGGDYVFCNFSAAGTVNAVPTTGIPVRIFIDNPHSTRCNGTAPNTNNPQYNTTNSAFSGKTFWNEGNFYAANGVGNSEGTTTPSGVQIYVVGDGASPAYDDSTYVQLGTPPSGLISTNPAVQSALVYAPTSDVLMTTVDCTSVLACTGGTFAGNLIGDDVTASATTITQDLNLANDPLYNGVNALHVQQYVQCSPLPTDASGKTYTALQANPATDTRGC